MTYFLSIKEMMPVADGGVDGPGRQIAMFNIVAEKVTSATFAEEVIAVLTAVSGLLTGVSVLTGSKAGLPAAASTTVLSVRITGGTIGHRVQNQKGIRYERVTASVRVHADKPSVAFAKAHAAFNALMDVVNQDVTPVS